MTKEFVPYEEALSLKELGFDEPTLYHWHSSEKRWPLTNEIYFSGCAPATNTGIKNIGSENHVWSAPLYQQAFRWFEDKHSLYVSRDVICNSNEILDIEYAIDSWRIGRNGVIFENPQDCFDTDKARLACLKKLIEIVKYENKKST